MPSNLIETKVFVVFVYVLGGVHLLSALVDYTVVRASRENFKYLAMCGPKGVLIPWLPRQLETNGT